MLKNKQEMKHLHIMITPEMQESLAKRAAKTGMPVSMMVRLWLAEKLKSKD